MNKFGWSYPPGCSGPPDDEPAISPQSEEVCFILEEEAGCAPEIIDKVVKIVDGMADTILSGQAALEDRDNLIKTLQTTITALRKSLQPSKR